MRLTERAHLLLGMAAAGMLLALAAGTPVPAMVAAALVALVAGARGESVPVDVERRVPAKVTAGEAFDADLSIRASDPERVSVREGAIVGDHVVESAHTSAPGVATTRVRPRQAGALAFTRVDLEARDKHDLARTSWTLPLPDTVRVGASATMLGIGRRIGRRAKVTKRPKRTAAAEREPEVDRLREHRPEDLLRDIDWKASARRTTLVSREWVKVPHSTVTILLDAGASMREGAVAPKMRTAIDAAVMTLAAATSAGLPTALVAWSEDGLEATARPGTTRASVQSALESLARLPPAPRRPRVAGIRVETSRLDGHERAFLHAAGHGASGGAAPIDVALAQVARTQRQPGWVVCIVDAEERPGLAALLLRRLQARGHRVTIVSPKNGPHHYRLSGTTPEDHTRLAEWLRERAIVQAECRRRRGQFISLGPNVAASDITEVMTFA